MFFLEILGKSLFLDHFSFKRLPLILGWWSKSQQEWVGLTMNHSALLFCPCPFPHLRALVITLVSQIIRITFYLKVSLYFLIPFAALIPLCHKNVTYPLGSGDPGGMTSHLAEQQSLPQHCTSTMLQFKISENNVMYLGGIVLKGCRCLYRPLICLPQGLI